MSIPHYAVLGHPVVHSLSPRIHAAFAQQTDIALTYLALDTEEAGLAATLARFAAAGGLGANVTVPDKSEAAGIAQVLSPRAVSYTHLDVYKRQTKPCAKSIWTWAKAPTW